ncbi:MAG TPA: hypothetical protein VFC69_00970 [Dysgonamonadaceae bacterium]|nr:hypothetical protein [Dysgonamonadaceae bacterium]
MKKFILFAAILFSAVTMVNAQTSNEGTANLTIKLNAVQSITVSGDVEIDYTTADDYANGKESTTFTTLSVVSAGGFAIRVEADDLSNGTSTMAAKNIEVTAEAIGDATGATFDANGTLERTTTKQALIESTTGGVNKQYTVKYKGDGGNEYMKNYNAGGTQTYTTTVTYTIAAN